MTLGFKTTRKISGNQALFAMIYLLQISDYLDTTGRIAEEVVPDRNDEEMVLLSNMESGGTSSDPEHGVMLANGEGHNGIQESRQLVRLKTKGIQRLDSRNDPAIGFLEAWQIPGVATYALCLFFSKLVAYTFLYWLPFYISQTRKFSPPPPPPRMIF
jgi:hypothetical protein